MSSRYDKRWATIGITAVVLAIAGFAFDAAGRREPVEPVTPALEDTGSRLVHQAFQQAVVMLHARDYESAVQALHEVLALRPDMPEAHVNMGFALVGLERYKPARDFFVAATDLRPGQFNAYYGLAVVEEALGDMPAAIGAMRTYLHLAPDDDPYRAKAEAALWEWRAGQASEGP